MLDALGGLKAIDQGTEILIIQMNIGDLS